MAQRRWIRLGDEEEDHEEEGHAQDHAPYRKEDVAEEDLEEVTALQNDGRVRGL